MFRIAVCDDDAVFCTTTEAIIKKNYPGSEVSTAVFLTGEKLCEVMEKGAYFDLILMDIELGSTTGVSVGKSLREWMNNQRTRIIFISAKTEYAMELFQVHPFDFLVKPVDEKKLISDIDVLLKTVETENRCYECRSGGEHLRISYGDIAYFESRGRKLTVHTREGNFDAYDRMDDVQTDAPEGFVRIHKSYLVNDLYIRRWNPSEVEMVTGETLSISESRRKAVREYLMIKGNR